MDQQKQNLENSTLILVLSISSILVCCCCGPLGLIMSIVALVLANKQIGLYTANPELYNSNSEINTGRIIAIIAIVLNSICTLLSIAYAIMFALKPEAMMDSLHKYQTY